MHTHPPVAMHKEAEVVLVHVGVCVELFGVAFVKENGGSDLVQISEAELGKIAAEFPRTGLFGHMKDLLCGFCMEKPQVTYNTWVQGFGDRFVDGYSSEGRQTVDLMMAKVEEH